MFQRDQRVKEGGREQGSCENPEGLTPGTGCFGDIGVSLEQTAERYPEGHRPQLRKNIILLTLGAHQGPADMSRAVLKPMRNWVKMKG